MSETTAPDLPAWATDEASGQIATPDAAKKANGWDSAERPPHGYMNWLQVQTYKALVYLKARLLATAGLQADTELTIASGSVTATQGNHTIDTEADAASDDLTNIVTTNLDDGRILIVRAANTARTVVLKHAAGGAGQIFLADSLDLSLDDNIKMVTLKRQGADWYEVSRSNQSLIGITGEIRMFGGSSAPSGWLFCNASAVSRSTYAGLFGVISTTYGVGDGSTTFNLPDFKGRTPIGVGTGSGLTARALAAKVGAENHQLTVNEMPVHDHSESFVTSGSGMSIGGSFTVDGQQTGPAGGDQAHNNMQPSLAVNFIIKF